MANPVPYNQLFDIDGLNNAIKVAERSADSFGKAATDDFKRSEKAAAALRKELEKINATISGKPIRITDESGKQAVADYAKQVATLTAQIKTQELAIQRMNALLTQNKQVISDAKAQTALYAAELAKGKVQTESIRTSIAQHTLAMRQQAEANRAARQAQVAATGSYAEAQKRLSDLGRAIKNTENGFKTQTPELRAQIKEYNTLNDALKKFDAQMGNHQRNVGNYKSAIQGVTGQLTSLVTGYLSIQGALALANKSFDVALSTDAIKTSLAFTLKSTTEADLKMKDLKATADRLGLSFIPLSEGYAKFTGAARAANFSLIESDRIFNSVTGAAARFHLTSDQLNGSLLAIQQMISKGTVQSEELRGQLGERLPGAFSIAARAMGVTEKELGKLLQSGQVLASDLLPKLATELDKTFDLDADTKIDSLTASTNRLSSAFDKAVQGDGVGAFFRQIVNGATNAIVELDKLFSSRSFQEVFVRLFSTDASNYDRFNEATDSFKSSQQRATTVKDPFSTDPEIARANVQKLTKAYQEAYHAYSLYYDGVKKGQIKNTESARETIQKYDENAKELYNLLVIVNDRYQESNKKAINGTKELTDAQLTSISAIRKRINELSKLDGSAVEGSVINNRIDALKKRLHDLTASTKQVKDGFALLEQQLQKVMTELQNEIIQDYAKHQGKESAETKKLAAAYQDLTVKLNNLKKAKDEALLNVSRADQIKRFGSVYPNAPQAPITEPTRELNNAQNVIDRNDAIDSLDDVYTKYAEINSKIIDSYKNRNITKSQLDSQLLESEKSQANAEYYYKKIAADRDLKVAKDTYGVNSKEYRRARAAISKLDADYNKQSLDNLLATEEAKRKIIQETLSFLDKSNSVFSSITGSQSGGKLFGDLQSSLLNGIGDSDRFQKAAEIGMDAIGTYTDFAISASQRRQAQLESEMQYELEGAGTNAEAKKKIEEEYTKRVNAEKTKQAKLQKAAAAVEIIINTAIAVSKVFGQTGIFGIGLAPIIAALGAVQLGLVLAQPIPQYEKGREGGKAEFAEVNEKGPELIGQCGNYRVANGGKRGYTYLNKGDKVFTADRTKQMLANQVDSADQLSKSRALYDTHIAMQNNVNIDYDRLASSFGDAAGKVKGTEFNLDEKGFNRYTVTKNARIKEVRSRNRI